MALVYHFFLSFSLQLQAKVKCEQSSLTTFICQIDACDETFTPNFNVLCTFHSEALTQTWQTTWDAYRMEHNFSPRNVYRKP
eukprot:4961933-Amphidinium_carterae.1